MMRPALRGQWIGARGGGSDCPAGRDFPWRRPGGHGTTLISRSPPGRRARRRFRVSTDGFRGDMLMMAIEEGVDVYWLPYCTACFCNHASEVKA